MSDAAPIGLFDSGVGGLSILRELRRLAPRADLLYVSDARYLPYGDRDEDFIRKRCFVISDFLLARGVQALVVACNSATAAAIAALRERYTVPVFGIEPAVKPATAMTRSGVVGILATASTLQSRKYAELVRRFGGFARVIDRPCRGLVEMVERGELQGPRLEALLGECIAPLLEAGADTLVLGCTHYPFLLASIRRLVPDEVTIIDPSPAVARHVVRELADRLEGAGSLAMFTTGDVHEQARMASLLLGFELRAESFD